MSKVFGKCLLALLLVAGAPFWGAAHATSVVFLNPGNSTETFWVGYSQFMQAAATDLGLDLRVRYSQRDAQTTIRQAREALQGPDRPDYLVVVNEQYVAPEILRLSQGSGVRLFVVNNALTADQQRLLGERQGRYPDWIGSMIANDEEAGYLMLKELIRRHGPLPAGQYLDLLAFSGMKNTPVAQAREQGLQRALAEHPEVRLRQLVYGEWNRQRAFEQAQQLLKRYPQTQLVWSANDEMALGAMEALEQQGRQPGRDVLFSALNSSQPALQALIDGRLTALIAGHFTLGGWAMVVLNDDARGLNPSAHGGPSWQLEVFQLLDKAQAQRLLELQRAQQYGVGFRAMTAEGKPAGYRYPFSLNLLLH
ncbi:ABC transporter substrate-binding protein [Pseudomonas sp. NFIX28]|uniref:ABC transporter substrate-binding protein n=1 Tax=Pseudomonas sp. NFIX28 TaxID=1566235 RepID=UPI0008947D09|nr:ABC transporter substrate-binding protein [Pseudomonas sp. NFIX28]SDZ59952.1 ABC-type sugar transport system, substrate-binding protein, contains N-terminal xre family HTH domain [Pseudomonas sp. NFIX28]